MKLSQSLTISIASVILMAGCASSGPEKGDSELNGASLRDDQQQGMESSGQADRELLSPSPVDKAQQVPEPRLLHFDFDQASVDPQYQALLKQHAEYLRNHPDATVRLEGHADERGTREYNMGLGERRAQNVRQGLKMLGVSDQQLAAISYGEEKPMVIGRDEQSYRANRRVELVYPETSRQASAGSKAGW